jgi:hypothetical protein
VVGGSLSQYSLRITADRRERGKCPGGSRLEGVDARAGAAGWGWGGAASKVYNTSTGSGSINLPFTLIAHGDILVMKPGLSTIHSHLGVSKFRIFLGDK